MCVCVCVCVCVKGWGFSFPHVKGLFKFWISVIEGFAVLNVPFQNNWRLWKGIWFLSMLWGGGIKLFPVCFYGGWSFSWCNIPEYLTPSSGNKWLFSNTNKNIVCLFCIATKYLSLLQKSFYFPDLSGKPGSAK